MEMDFMGAAGNEQRQRAAAEDKESGNSQSSATPSPYFRFLV
jgi:hypothetical protein